MRGLVHVIAASIFLLLPQTLWAQQDQKWVVSWAASAHGPYPIGNPSAQPDQRFAFPSPPAGANDQTFRLIVRPDIWGRQARLRFTNAFGTKPITFDGAFVGLQLGGAGLGQRHEPARHLRRQGERDCGAGQHCLERCRRAHFRARPGGGGARGTQARRQFPRRGRERPDDLAREGADHILRHRARRRLERQGRGRGRVSLQHRVVVLPRRRRDDGAVGQFRAS